MRQPELFFNLNLGDWEGELPLTDNIVNSHPSQRVPARCKRSTSNFGKGRSAAGSLYQ